MVIKKLLINKYSRLLSSVIKQRSSLNLYIYENMKFCTRPSKTKNNLDGDRNIGTMLRISNVFGRALRETGQALDRLGLTIAENDIFKETYSRHRPVMNLFDKV